MVLDPRREGGMRVDTAGSTLDVAPTLLSFLGYDGEMALGTNLMAADSESTARAAFVRSRLDAWRQPLLKFWAFPKIEQYVEVDARRRVVTIDGRPFAVPAIIEVDESLQTVIRFPKPRRPSRLVAEESDGKPFILAALCDPGTADSPDARICLFTGYDNRVRAQVHVPDIARLSPSDVRRMLSLPS
jgi:hypothetical protein